MGRGDDAVAPQPRGCIGGSPAPAEPAEAPGSVCAEVEAAAPERCPPCCGRHPGGAPRRLGAFLPARPQEAPRGRRAGASSRQVGGRQWPEEGSREAAGPGHRTQGLAKAGKGKRDGRKGRRLKLESAKWPRLPLREGHRHRVWAQPSPAPPCPVPPEPPTHPALGSVARAASTPTLCSGWGRDRQKHRKLPPGDEPLAGPDTNFFGASDCIQIINSNIKLAQQCSFTRATG